MGWGDKTGPKIKKRKSANEYTQVFSVAVTTRRLIASSHKTAYLMNNTQTHTVESTQHSVSPQAIVICAGFQASKAHQCTTRCTEDQKKKKNGTCPSARMLLCVCGVNYQKRYAEIKKRGQGF